MKSRKGILTLSIASLLSCSLFAQSVNNVKSKTVSIDSLSKRIIIEVLKKNGQPKTKKLFVDTTTSVYSFSLMQSFFLKRTNKQVTNVSDYNIFFYNLESLANQKILSIDTIKKFFSTNRIFQVISEQQKEEFIDSLSSKYTGVLLRNVPEQSLDTNSIANPSTLIKSPNPISQNGLIWFCIGAACMAAAWLVVKFTKNKKQRGISKEKKHHDKMNEDLEFNFVALEKKFETVSKENLQLKRDLKIANDKILELTMSLNQAKPGAEKEIEHKTDVNSPKVLYRYFSTPLNDGSFNKADGRDSFLEGASIYRFKIESDSYAEFEFCNEPSSVSMALNNKNELILSVAEEKEGNAFNAKEISTYHGHKGKARLEKNKWIVVEKLQIKYS